MTPWVVVTEDSYTDWEATTDDEADVELRIAVLEWVLDLQDTGPPPGGEFDEDRGLFSVEVDDTGVWIDYVVRQRLDPPAIVIRKYTRRL